MDIMDLASKGIAAIAKNFGKKVAKQGPAPEIEQKKPTVISGSAFRAGFAREEIMPDLSDKDKIYWIAGHGSGHRMEGVLTPVYISAVWLDCGSDEEGILWIGADIVGLTRIEVNAIRAKILANPEIKGCKLINFSCTHSHSGIDTVGYWGKPNLVNIPSNGKDPQYMAMLEEKAVEVAVAAYKNRKAGKLFNGRIEVKDGLATGRRFKYKHEVLARFRFAPDDGSKEIWMLNFAAHPNSLGGDNRLLSAEYPYYLREKIAKENGADVLYAIGPLGGMDAAEYDDKDRVHNIQLQGETIADAAMKISDEELKPEIKFIQQPFYYPVGNYVLTLLAMRNVMSFKAYPSDKTDIGIAIESELTYMTVGGQKLLLLPGENFMPTVYGEYFTAEESGTGEGPEINPTPLADIAGDKSIIVFGVSNDMTGYVVPPNDFVLHPTQPYLNTTSDRLGNRHYHETNALDKNAQKTIADTFAQVVRNFG